MEFTVDKFGAGFSAEELVELVSRSTTVVLTGADVEREFDPTPLLQAFDTGVNVSSPPPSLPFAFPQL